MYEFSFFQSPTFEILDLYMQKIDRTRPIFFADELCTVYCSLFETLISTEFGRLHGQILYFFTFCDSSLLRLLLYTKLLSLGFVVILSTLFLDLFYFSCIEYSDRLVPTMQYIVCPRTSI